MATLQFPPTQAKRKMKQRGIWQESCFSPPAEPDSSAPTSRTTWPEEIGAGTRIGELCRFTKNVSIGRHLVIGPNGEVTNCGSPEYSMAL
jgi:hypothetical protein